VYHSTLSSSLNYGLLTPLEVVQDILDISAGIDLGDQSNAQLLHSTEGIIRQIIGWREWIKGLYDHVYTEEIEQRNFFEAKNPLPEYWWKLDSDDEEITDNAPLAYALEKTKRLAYNHHIERLMVIANWMTLKEYNPQECFKWFSSMYVDAFEWVMVPNVYGMGLFSDGGVFASKPYVASSNYIKKMSDYPKGPWQEIWTKAFWDFLEKHQEHFVKQHRLGMLLKSHLNKKITKN
jgi:deoxyribodipyrimidine photolyase-related protein